MNRPKILVFASGTPEEGGGSGFENLVLASRTNGKLNADIIGVVSNYGNGGVRKRADRLQIPFRHFPKPWVAEEYQRIARESGADFFALSGWLKLVKGLDLSTKFNSRAVFNIHPGPLPKFGGPGFFGHHVHEAVMEAFRRGEISYSAVCMHFVTEPKGPEDYDRGPVFFKFAIKIKNGDTPETLGKHVNEWEHIVQPTITNLVVHGLIKWDGIDHKSLKVPLGYEYHRVML
jgi:folate-dependent phosphoribosylglycinamide formyltransferase PurN